MIRGAQLMFAASLLALSASPAFAQSAANPAVTIAVDARTTGPRIDRNLFGQFAEHLGTGIYGGIWVGRNSTIPNVRGIRKDVVAALRAIKVPNVRWPGGCFADEYHWRDGVGPAQLRGTSINTNWGGAVEPNTFGTDEYFDFIDQIGSEAYVSVNVGSGTVEEAADWVAYMTADPKTSAGKARVANGHPAPYKLKFLGLGNESWGCGGSFTPEHYVELMKPFARFTHNYNAKQTGEEAMQRIAVGPDGDKTEYTEAVMKAYKERTWAWGIEGLSLHSYTTNGRPPAYASENFDENAYASLIRATLNMDRLIRTHAAIMDKYDPEKKVPLVVDEWGVWLKPNAGSDPGFLQQQNSMRDAIIAALNFNIFARHADRVRMSNIAQMINVLQAMILTDKEKMVLTPTYYVYKLYVPFQGATFVPVKVDAGNYTQGDVTLPRVDAIAARDGAGKLWLAVTNVDPNRSARVETSFAGVSVHGARGEVLTAPRFDSVNSFAAPSTVVPKPFAGSAGASGVVLDVPAHSVAVVQVE